jgi:hypothetical protein
MEKRLFPGNPQWPVHAAPIPAPVELRGKYRRQRYQNEIQRGHLGRKAAPVAGFQGVVHGEFQAAIFGANGERGAIWRLRADVAGETGRKWKLPVRTTRKLG